MHRIESRDAARPIPQLYRSAGVCTKNLNPDVVMMKSAKDGV